MNHVDIEVIFVFGNETVFVFEIEFFFFVFENEVSTIWGCVWPVGCWTQMDDV